MDGLRKWNKRPLKGMGYPFLQADALVIRVRENHKVVKKIIQLAIGVSEAGYRKVLGIRVARQESEVSWTEFFTWLNKRGLAGVDYVTSDNHEGLNLALGKIPPCGWLKVPDPLFQEPSGQSAQNRPTAGSCHAKNTCTTHRQRKRP